MLARVALLSALAIATPTTLLAQYPPAAPTFPTPEGYLCCNMRSNGSWISDINYAEPGTRVIAAGTPAKATGYGRYRVHVDVGGSKQSIGNDYSRNLDMGAFAQRYIVSEDPKAKLAAYPAKVRSAITSARVSPGMTKEQVIMAVGYPVSSENPNLDAKMWRYWLSSFAEFQVMWDDTGRVKEIVGDATTRNLVVAE
jgi:hypothetical protein